MKKALRFVCFVFTCLLAFSVFSVCTSVDVYADDASITLSIWPQEAEVGESVTVTVTIKGDAIANCSFSLKYPQGLVDSSTGTDGVIPINATGPTQVQYTFVAKAEGNAYFSTTEGQFTDSQGQALSVTPAGGQLPIGQKAEKTEEEKTTEDKTEEKTTEEDKDDEEEDGFEYKLDGISFKIIDKPDSEHLPYGFEKAVLKIDDVNVDAYKDTYNGDLYIVYAKNQQGEIGPFIYDLKNKTLSDYEPVGEVMDAATASSAEEAANGKNEASTGDAKTDPLIPETRYIDKEKDEGFFTRTVLKRLLMMMVVLFVIMCVIIIVLIVKNGNLQTKLYGDDKEDDESDDESGIHKKKSGDSKDDDKGSIQNPLRTGKDHTYSVNEDTGEILLEEALDNNAGSEVPPAVDGESDIAKAMRERPYGVDSAFDVVPAPEEETGAEGTTEIKDGSSNDEFAQTAELSEEDMDYIEQAVNEQDNQEEAVETPAEEAVEASAEEAGEAPAEESAEEVVEAPAVESAEEAGEASAEIIAEKEDDEPQKVALPGQFEDED